MVKRPGDKTGCSGGGGCLIVPGVMLLAATLIAHGAALNILRVFGGVLLVLGILLLFLKPKKKPSVTSTATRGWQGSPWFPKLSGAVFKPSGVRLPCGDAPVKSLIGVTIFALFWNGFIWGIYYLITHQAGSKPLPTVPKVILGAFAVVGVLLIIGVVRQIALVLFVGDTFVELAHEPVLPGQSVSATIFQAGNFPITSLTVTLICTEVVTYRQGTDTVTSREKVHDEKIHEQQNLTARGGQTLAQFTLRIPADAVPSFAAPNNKLEWHLEVKMDIPSRPDVSAKFPFRICPP